MPDKASKPPGKCSQDLTGHKFGRLTVIAFAGRKVGPPRNRPLLWLCECECTNKITTTTGCLKSGNTLSCGCYQKEQATKTATIHGGHDDPLYSVWIHMRERCQNPNLECYDRYGGRGIHVCEEWKDFSVFRSDMGPSYKEGLTLDRRNNLEGYSKSNCRWATTAEQNRNRRDNKFLEFGDENLCMAAWDERLGFAKGTVSRRIGRHWTIEKALTTPLRKRNPA